MSEVDPTGTPWTDEEVDQVVFAYFKMLDHDLRGERYVKAEFRRQVQSATNRSKGSVEYKLQNVSAVLQCIGLPWILGYKPARNYQKSLVEGVRRYLDGREDFQLDAPLLGGLATPSISEGSPLVFESPPDLNLRPQQDQPNEAMVRLVRKYDYAARDARNRELGELGEQRVLMHERSRLEISGRGDLARKVRWVSKEDGDGAGYDILSFDNRGSERLLEVKTTNGGQANPFYLSENERALSEERPDAFCLVRLYDFARKPRGFELTPPLNESLLLKPTIYRASLR